MKRGAWKAWVVFALLILAYGLVGEMELRDLERLQAAPLVAEGVRW